MSCGCHDHKKTTLVVAMWAFLFSSFWGFVIFASLKSEWQDDPFDPNYDIYEFCETGATRTGRWFMKSNQPLSAISNFAFILAGLFCHWRFVRTGLKIFAVVGVLVVLVGCMSVAYHASNNVGYSGDLDIWSIFLIIGCMLMYAATSQIGTREGLFNLAAIAAASFFFVWKRTTFLAQKYVIESMVIVMLCLLSGRIYKLRRHREQMAPVFLLFGVCLGIAVAWVLGADRSIDECFAGRWSHSILHVLASIMVVVYCELVYRIDALEGEDFEKQTVITRAGMKNELSPRVHVYFSDPKEKEMV